MESSKNSRSFASIRGYLFVTIALLGTLAAHAERIIPPANLFRDPTFVRDFVGEAGVDVGSLHKLSMTFSDWFSVRGFCGGSLMSAFCRIEFTRQRIPDNGVEPVDDVQPAARMVASRKWLESRSNTDKSADDR